MRLPFVKTRGKARRERAGKKERGNKNGAQRECALIQGWSNMKTLKIVAILPLIAGVCWGSIGVFVRILTAQGLDNGTIVCTRMLVSALLMAVFMLISNKKLFKIPLKAVPVLILGGVLGSSYMNVVYNVAILHLHLALSSVLIGMFALWAIFLGRIFFKEALTARKLICVAIALFGVTLVSGVLEGSSVGSLSLFGLFMGVMSGIMYAFNGVANRILSDWGMSAITINFWFFAMGAVSLIPFCHWGQVAAMVSADAVGGVFWLVAQSVVCAILPYVLFTIALSKMDLGLASTLELIEPVAAMVFGLVLFGEVPTPLMVLGVVLVVIAIAATFRTPAARTAE